MLSQVFPLLICNALFQALYAPIQTPERERRNNPRSSDTDIDRHGHGEPSESGDATMVLGSDKQPCGTLGNYSVVPAP